MSSSTTAFAPFAFAGKACIVSLLLLLAKGIYWAVNKFIIAPPHDVLNKLSGPDAGALQNHFQETMDPTLSPDTHENWVKKYGKTFRFHGFGRHDYRLMSLDFRVISHVLNSPLYEKPWQTRTILSRLLGRGIVACEGAEHKRLRRLIGPAFTTQAVKAMSPVFFQKAEELRDRWDTLISEASASTTAETQTETEKPTASAAIDVAHWVSRATFDVIGLAGFNYNFHCLQDESEEVYQAYRKMFDIAEQGPNLRGLLELYFPAFERFFPDADQKLVRGCLKTIKKAGEKIVADGKNNILAEKCSAEDINEKDILSLLIKSNMSSDPSKRMSDSELHDQLSTFLFGGSDSTGLAITYALHQLSLHPEIQTKLRQEIIDHSDRIAEFASRPSSPASCCDDEPRSPSTYPTPPASASGSSNTEYSFQVHAESIDSLSVLDSVVKEALRLCPPVHSTIRTATEDDVIPVSSPVKMRDGTIVQPGETISIGKGSYIHIPIEGLNMSTDIWGEDAREFNPARWASLPPTAKAPIHPGHANLMTFSFGPHSCPGWKFTMLEMKLFLYTLLPQFTFENTAKVVKYNSILTRPYEDDKYELGPRLPIKVGRYVPAL